jgi:hypothetical protein
MIDSVMPFLVHVCRVKPSFAELVMPHAIQNIFESDVAVTNRKSGAKKGGMRVPLSETLSLLVRTSASVHEMLCPSMSSAPSRRSWTRLSLSAPRSRASTDPAPSTKHSPLIISTQHLRACVRAWAQAVICGFGCGYKQNERAFQVANAKKKVF